MRLATLYRVMATVCVLVADRGVRADGDDGLEDKAEAVTAPGFLPAAQPLAITAAESPASGAELSPAVAQGASAPVQGNGSSISNSPSAAAQASPPGANQVPDRAPSVVAVQGPGEEMKIDPATGDLLGGNPPSKSLDLPVTIVFLLLFLTGAITHISIYRANAKRGHKFLLSDLMFDFCMIRSVTCIFRITWVFSQLRVIILLAQIFFNGGAAVIFIVNIFFAQRIVRSMHPVVGWGVPFSLLTRVLALSVPPVIILQVVSISILFFSTDSPDRADIAAALLKFGSSWNIWVVTFPFLVISIACAIPGPKPEKFGSGSLRVKTSLAMLGAALLATGATVRTYGTFNPRPIDSGDVLYSKAVFYTTQFTFEIIVVALYAFARIDLLFHIPNGSSKRGDYSANKAADMEKAALVSRGYIRDKIEETGLYHQILRPSDASPFVQPGTEPVFAVFYPSVPDAGSLVDTTQGDMAGEGKLPPRPTYRVSRRQSVVAAVRSTSGNTRRYSQASFALPVQQRPPRPPRMTRSMYRTSDEASELQTTMENI